MSNLLKSKTTAIVSIQKLMAGLTKHYAGQTLTFDGTPTPIAAILAELQGYLTLLQALEVAHGAWSGAVQAVDEQKPSTEALIANLNAFLRAAFGATSTTIGDFGLTPRRPRKQSVASKANAIERSQATRIARNTMGPKKKAAIHGVVPAPASTPAQAPAEAPAIVTPNKPAKTS